MATILFLCVILAITIKIIFMKRVIYSFVSIGFLTLSTLYAKPGKSPVVLTGEQAAQKYPGTELVRVKDFSNIPNYVRFAPGHEIELNQLESWLGQYTQNQEGVSLNLIKEEKDVLGYTHYRYQQTIQGFPITGALVNAHVQNGVVKSINGDLIDRLSTIPTQAVLTEAQALKKATDFVGADVYKWELASEEAFLKREQEDPNATFFPKGELVVLNNELALKAPLDLRLAYKFNIYAHKPMSRQEVYIDAQTGLFIYSENKIHHTDVPGTAQTAYSGTQTITVDQTGGSYRLRETGRGQGIETYDVNTGTSYSSAVDFTDADNNWNNVNPQLDQYATDAHWGSEMTYDYFMIKHARNSIDGAGFKLRSYVHYDVDFVNAFWDGTRMTYGDGDPAAGFTPLTSIDVAGHEITHGLVSNTADLIYQSESGALNESFADIFGVSVDYYARPSQANFLMGEELSSGGAFRSMQDPNAFGDPDTYGGTYWKNTSPSAPDYGGVHSNSGVQNFWYYLMVTGGSGTNDNSDAYTVIGIGLESAGKIAFRNLTVYLGPNSDYDEARFYAVQSAIDLFGNCSPELATTENAWYAVGVGGPSTGGGADFQADMTQICSLPATVNFTTSGGSTNYSWDFGDGGFSTTQNPSHIYATTGSFTVILQISGGACGADTVTKTSYIVVDTSIACPVILLPGGTLPTQTACDGLIYDDGGSSGDYEQNTGHAYVTIAPTGATSITFNFLDFDMEDGTLAGLCDYDYIAFHDGTSASAPLIAKYCGTNLPTGSFTSPGGTVFIDFFSDPYLAGRGIELEWSCNTGGTVGLPTADFSLASHLQVCTGTNVTFTNLSSGATSYLWSIIGATPSSSTAASPTVTYSAPGTFSATLTAYNSAGQDLEFKQNYIIVVQSAVANFTQSATGLAVNFTDLSVGSTSWSWNFGDGATSTLQSPSHTYAAAGTYNVCLTSDNATCPSNNFCTSVTVFAPGTGQPTAGASVSSNNVCEGDTVNFYNQSTGSPTSFMWSFPGGNPASSTAANPTVVYATQGIYNVDLTVTNSYGSDAWNSTSYIYVYGDPTANFTHLSSALTVNFIDQSTDASSFVWNFGDGTTSNISSPVHSYATPGTYYVCLTASNPSCPADVYCDSIWVAPTSINSLTQDYYMQVFPNPSNGILNIKISSDKLLDYSIRITDLLGKEVMNKQLNHSNNVHEVLDVKNYPAGTYLLFINDAPHKIVIE